MTLASVYAVYIFSIAEKVHVLIRLDAVCEKDAVGKEVITAPHLHLQHSFVRYCVVLQVQTRFN